MFLNFSKKIINSLNIIYQIEKGYHSAIGYDILLSGKSCLVSDSLFVNLQL